MALRSVKLPASIWLTNAGVKDVGKPPMQFPKMHNVKDRHYDVVVVGGGIFGVSTAYALKNSGKRVALLEGRTIGCGTTGYSTAKLSAQQGPLYQMIKQKRDSRTARDYYDINMNGIRNAEQIVTQLGLDCEWQKRPHMTWTGQSENVGTIKSEYETCKELGIPARLLDSADLLKELPASLHPQLAIAFDDMVQFNSYKFCKELAKHINGDGCEVYEDSRVTSVSENISSAVTSKAAHDIELEDNQSKLSADYVVLATHLPIMDRSLHFAVVSPSRSHCVAVRVKPNSQGMSMMSVNADMPMRSMRTDSKDENVIVISGDKVEMGDRSDTYQCYEDLEKWAFEHFEVEDVVARWSAMDYATSDHVPYLGYLHPGTKTIFTATGFSKWGLAFSLGGAEVVNDLMHGRQNRLADSMNAQRWNTLPQYQNLAMENAHTASHLVSDKIKNALTIRGIKDLQPGEGAICKHGIKNVGAYCDENGALHVVEPVCTHLGCDVVFNQGDKCWDCPCHGSQFAVDGAVVHGPAVKPLCQVKDIEW